MPFSDAQLTELTPEQLLTLLIEEASETIHAACKAIRHGFDGAHPDGPSTETNVVVICREAEQASATARILGAKFYLSYSDIVLERHARSKEQTERRGLDAGP